MSDVSELVGHLRGFAELPFEGGNVDPLIEVMHGIAFQAADVIETLAGENERLKRAWEAKHASQSAATAEAEVMFRLAQEAAAERDALSARLAKLAPVVEAARQEVASGMCQSVRLIEALATLEADHD